MSRHRNVRSMRYSDEYDGYDDVYGHSVEDDYSISPSEAAFMYDRSTQQRQLSSLLSAEENIAEEDEVINDKPEVLSLNELDKAKLMSCLDEMRNVLGDSIPEQTLSETIINSNYDITIALDKVLNKSVSSQKKDKESPKPQRTTPFRRYERGGRIPNKLACNKLNDGKKEDMIKINSCETDFFNVQEFLSSSVNKDSNLELSRALLKKNRKHQTEKDFLIDKNEKKASLNLNKDDFFECDAKKENIYSFQKMTIDELQKVRPSRLGFFVCKCLTEVDSSITCVLRSHPSSINIIPFKFNCLSPDEEVISKRKW
ncbi:unnamed protein product [Nezara viridula]|uniref:HBS1-like protein N-terminal domain-containing protein n=1 Tax=Nezara viridula TaxID=85310 RepID=A0A9P0E765_NEZVI|nr:unnamed protein product [Nezara viridula]